MPSPPSYGCCTRVNFVLKKHLLFQMNLSNSGLKNRSIKEYWLIFTVLKFPLGLQFSHNLTKLKIIKYISTIYIMTTTCTYLQQLTQVSDVAHGPLVESLCLEGALGMYTSCYMCCMGALFLSDRHNFLVYIAFSGCDFLATDSFQTCHFPSILILQMTPVCPWDL